jgi:hypothetical protein
MKKYTTAKYLESHNSLILGNYSRFIEEQANFLANRLQEYDIYIPFIRYLFMTAIIIISLSSACQIPLQQ